MPPAHKRRAPDVVATAHDEHRRENEDDRFDGRLENAFAALRHRLQIGTGEMANLYVDLEDTLTRRTPKHGLRPRLLTALRAA